jgi:hypothetical protein
MDTENWNTTQKTTATKTETTTMKSLAPQNSNNSNVSYPISSSRPEQPPLETTTSPAPSKSAAVATVGRMPRSFQLSTYKNVEEIVSSTTEMPGVAPRISLLLQALKSIE